ncbi:MAG: hypothetical protein HOM80_09100, partial [Bacteroidetes bacterium]|nr:hypothetical protein [Bacteroidota bacterium]
MSLPSFYIFLIIYYLLLSFSVYKLFPLAGIASWKALVPVYNLFPILKLSGRSWWWFLLLLIPGVNLLMLVIIVLGILKSFGIYNNKELIIYTLIAPLSLIYLAMTKKP